MDIIIYTIIFIIGILFGSFFTLAVYRIPLGENIVYKRSFCPHCNHKLNFKDLIPIFSYIFLGGKCAYCGKKIRVRYILFEILTGITFLLFALSLNEKMYLLSIDKMIYLFFYVLYISSIFIIAGIDKENVKIQKSMLVFGFFLSICYMTYVCIKDYSYIYTYIIYLMAVAILLLVNAIFTKKKLYDSYAIYNLMLILYMLVFTDSILVYLSIIIAVLWVAFEMLITKIIKYRYKIKKTINIKQTIGFYLCVSNIILIILGNFVCNWVMK